MTRAARDLRVRPFRALRYPPEPHSGRDGRIAPPYDVISPPQRERLARHPHNVVHLDLPEAGPGADPYQDAAERLRAWIRDGVLIRDERPALYLCEQQYQGPAGPMRRRGLFVRLDLEPYDAGVIIPHERTLERPRLDRRRLLEATRTHLSAVFMLHPDPDARVSRLLAEEIRNEPVLLASDGEGIGYRLVRLQETGVIERIQELLRNQWALIADGHHRYESALAYHESRLVQGAHDAGHLLAFLCSLEDEGLIILPIHRLVHSVPGFSPDRVQKALAAWFDLEPIDDPRRLGAAVHADPRRPGVFGLLFGAGGGAFVARWKVGAGLDLPVMQAVPEPLRRLDVILLHRLVLEEVLGIDSEAQARQAHLDYVKDEAQLLERAEGALLGVLLNPTRIEQVVEVGKAGLRLPQKTTYFQPKVPSGLVIDPLDG
jgi:uncharacterized protein (DUF1015 family)